MRDRAAADIVNHDGAGSGKDQTKRADKLGGKLLHAGLL